MGQGRPPAKGLGGSPAQDMVAASDLAPTQPALPMELAAMGVQGVAGQVPGAQGCGLMAAGQVSPAVQDALLLQAQNAAIASFAAIGEQPTWFQGVPYFPDAVDNPCPAYMFANSGVHASAAHARHVASQQQHLLAPKSGWP